MFDRSEELKLLFRTSLGLGLGLGVMGDSGLALSNRPYNHSTD